MAAPAPEPSWPPGETLVAALDELSRVPANIWGLRSHVLRAHGRLRRKQRLETQCAIVKELPEESLGGFYFGWQRGGWQKRSGSEVAESSCYVVVTPHAAHWQKGWPMCKDGRVKPLRLHAWVCHAARGAPLDITHVAAHRCGDAHSQVTILGSLSIYSSRYH